MTAPKTYSLSALVLSCAVLLSGCANLERFEPGPDPVPDSEKVVEIAVRSNSVEQLVLGELYKQGLERLGRPATLNMGRLGLEHSFDRVPNGAADVAIVCAGRMLGQVQPQKAKELEMEFSAAEKDVNSGDQREKVYQAVMGALGDNVNATDPSNALGCSDELSAIPQHIIPIYRVPTLNREERGALNIISGTISTEELAELVEESKKVRNTSEVVMKYLDDNGIFFH
ncbi:hypothetical protein CMUST_06140 [Corynebacterium mustelae]|uniref:Uncharacterized protein n=1 Tax=Corynebacterium mustelae TaxID=571915 RepID=A0A0G3GWM2_9CORY|nr:hypothetical protein [Corynebacterium mustelae]AKK05564.1 hypothetical protein CMUST_06140 [Corynebacterium mustelae]